MSNSVASAAGAAFRDAAAGHRLAPVCQTFYFLRHGQTARNAQRIFQDADEPLDATGRAQAVAAAAVLARHPVARIVASDMLRTRETASAVAAPGGWQIDTHADLRERHFGCLIGTPSGAPDWACAPAGGETLGAFVARTARGLRHALALPDRVLVVAHGGTLHALAALLPLDAAPALFAMPIRCASTASVAPGARCPWPTKAPLCATCPERDSWHAHKKDIKRRQ